MCSTFVKSHLEWEWDLELVFNQWNVAKMMLHEFQNLGAGCFAASAFALLHFSSSPSKEALAGLLNDKRSLGETVIAKSQH